MAIKDDYIKIRVSKEQKELFKDIAKKKNISMSKFIIVSTEERALREKEKFEGTKSLELRVSELEQKLQEIKLKMERQKAEKETFFKSFFDIIKKSVVSEFTGTISIGDMMLSLVTAFVIGLLIIWVYRKTYSGVVYSKSFALSVILLGMVTALIIGTINSNLALSLGMVGALSIVRFRTAVKEPVDTVFMFWAISAGIMAGAGLYIVAIVSSIALGILYFISYTMSFKRGSKYLFVLKYNIDMDEQIEKVIKKLPKYKLKSKSITGDIIELTYEIELSEGKTELLNKFKGVNGIISASLISYQSDFGA